jgi:hypothetical protein
MSKRKITTLVLSFVMMLSLSACGIKSNDTPTTPSFNTTPTITSGANSATTTPSGASNLQTCMTDKSHNVLFGTISTKEICMDIYQNGNDITVFYVFKNQDNEYKLTGKIDGFKLSLKDDEQNSLTGTVTSADEIGRFQGTLTQSNGIKLPVALDMHYAFQEPFENNYEDIGSNNQEVGTFISELKNNVITSNKQAIATVIHYPIKVNINSKNITLNSSQEFIDNYTKIMNQDFVHTISNAYTKFLFHNYQGITFGSGQYNIWIQKTGEKFEIVGINN